MIAAMDGGPVCDDASLVVFLQWALPQRGMRWAGFRKVRGQVRKRLRRRLIALELSDLEAYRALLERDESEWTVLDGLCRISISRFWRDRGVFEALSGELLPELARRAEARPDRRVRAWSAGCASGEEPYSLAMAWSLSAAKHGPDVRLELQATDADPNLLERARRGVYSPGTLRELPPALRDRAFDVRGDDLVLEPELGAAVAFEQQDLREQMPAGPFDLVLCRNLAFTYFAPSVQRRVLESLAARLPPGGLLVLGSHEPLPEPNVGWARWRKGQPIYRRVP